MLPKRVTLPTVHCTWAAEELVSLKTPVVCGFVRAGGKVQVARELPGYVAPRLVQLLKTAPNAGESGLGLHVDGFWFFQVQTGRPPAVYSEVEMSGLRLRNAAASLMG